MNSPKSSAYVPIRNVHRVRRLLVDGRSKYHFYHRKTRDKLPGQPGSPEFMSVYQQCEGRPTTPRVSVDQAEKFKTNTPTPEQRSDARP